MDKKRYQYIFAIAFLLITHIIIMVLWIGNIKQPATINALNTDGKIPQKNH